MDSTSGDSVTTESNDIAWHRRINTSAGLTPEQLAILVDRLGDRVERWPDDDHLGGMSDGAEAALDDIIELVGQLDEDEQRPFGTETIRRPS